MDSSERDNEYVPNLTKISNFKKLNEISLNLGRKKKLKILTLNLIIKK